MKGLKREREREKYIKEKDSRTKPLKKKKNQGKMGLEKDKN